MASTISRHTWRRSLISLPPHLRMSTYQNARSFSASASRQISIVDMAVAPPLFVMNGVHSLGIPWYATLPLTATIMRSVVVYYLGTRRTRQNMKFRNTVAPLVSAHVALKAANDSPESDVEKQLTGPLRAITRIGRVLTMGFQERLRMNRIFRRTYTSPWAFLNFGILISFAESVRMKCGGRDGLLSLLVSPFEWIRQRIDPDFLPVKSQTEPVDRAEALTRSIEAARDKKLAMASAQVQDTQTGKLETWSAEDWQQALGQQAQQQTTSEAIVSRAPNTSSPYFDPSLQTEGLDWCTDLTLPDATLTLPLILAATVIVTSVLRPRPYAKPSQITSPVNSRQQYTILPEGLSAWVYNLSLTQRLGVCFGVVFFYASQQFPAAVLLYLIPSLASGWIQNRYLDIKHPVHPPIQPCKRPMRMKVRRQWN